MVFFVILGFFHLHLLDNPCESNLGTALTLEQNILTCKAVVDLTTIWSAKFILWRIWNWNWKFHIYFSHSNLSMFYTYLPCPTSRSTFFHLHLLSPIERSWNRDGAAGSYFLVMILPFQLQKQSGSNRGTENQTVQFLNIKIWRRQRSTLNLLICDICSVTEDFHLELGLTVITCAPPISQQDLFPVRLQKLNGWIEF